MISIKTLTAALLLLSSGVIASPQRGPWFPWKPTTIISVKQTITITVKPTNTVGPPPITTKIPITTSVKLSTSTKVKSTTTKGPHKPTTTETPQPPTTTEVSQQTTTTTIPPPKPTVIPPKFGYPGLKGLNNWFSFGDSYTQTGFNLTNGAAYPSPGNPLGNPSYPGWTSSNGPNWVGYLATKYNQSELLTYNLAYGGATVDSKLVAPWRDDVLSLRNQVEDLFIPYLTTNSTPWYGGDSLFSFFIGINDVGNTYWDSENAYYYEIILNVYFALVQRLYVAGARNFLFLNVPPIDRSPLTVGQGEEAVELEKQAIVNFNKLINERAKEFAKNHNEVWVKVFDTNALFTEVLDNPEPYGITDTTTFCEQYQNGTPEWTTFYDECDIPVDEYFWLNNLHPGYKVNDALAAAIAEELE